MSEHLFAKKNIPQYMEKSVTQGSLEQVGSDIIGHFCRSRSQLDHPEDLDNLKSSDLKGQIEELRNIKASVNNELRDLESKRQGLLSEIANYKTQVNSVCGLCHHIDVHYGVIFMYSATFRYIFLQCTADNC